MRERWVRWLHKLLNTNSLFLNPTAVEEILVWNPWRPLDDAPYGYEVAEGIRAMMNQETVGPAARKKKTPLFMCFMHFSRASDSVFRTLLWTVLTRFGVPQRIFADVRQFHNGMQACMRLEDANCSGMLDVGSSARVRVYACA